MPAICFDIGEFDCRPSSLGNCPDRHAFFDLIRLGSTIPVPQNWPAVLPVVEDGVSRRGRFGYWVKAKLPSGNELLVRYARRVHFDNIPVCTLTFRSVCWPVTRNEVQAALAVMFGSDECCSPSLIELTFDLTCPPSFVEEHLRSRAGRFSRDRTLYIGSPKSRWQAKVYTRHLGFTRLEFMLRRRFLHSLGFDTVDSVGNLATCEVLWRMLRPVPLPSSPARLMFTPWWYQLPAAEQTPSRPPARPIVDAPPSPFERHLRLMQANVIW